MKKNLQSIFSNSNKRQKQKDSDSLLNVILDEPVDIRDTQNTLHKIEIYKINSSVLYLYQD